MMSEGGKKADDPSMGRRALVLFCILLPAAAALVLGFWKWKGETGLLGSLAGLAFGGLVSLVGHLLRKRVLSASGPKVVARMMLQVCASFGLFIGVALLLALLWRESAVPVLITGLGIYLIVSFYEAATART